MLKKIINNDTRFARFIQFMKENEFDIVIDGANLGYYNNTYPMNFKNIDICYKYYISNGFKPLIILHKRHHKSNSFMNNWIYNNSIYFTDGMNDDCFRFLQPL